MNIIYEFNGSIECQSHYNCSLLKCYDAEVIRESCFFGKNSIVESSVALRK